MLRLIVMALAVACLVVAGVGFAGFGIYQALAPNLGVPLAGMVTGALALVAAVLLTLPAPRPPRVAADDSELEELTSLAGQHPLTAVVLATLVGAGAGARR